MHRAGPAETPAAAPAAGPPATPRPARRAGSRAWAWSCLSLALLAGLAGFAPAPLLDWQPARWSTEPWRWWTAAFVHWSDMHLAANVAGCAVLAAFAAAAGTPPRALLAWALAWPLTHLALLAEPLLAHYGGLSGVLHAGVAVVATGLVRQRAAPRASRLIGAAVLAGLAAKVMLERPWAGPLAQPAGWDIAVAPLAHAAGAVAGVIAALVLAPRESRR